MDDFIYVGKIVNTHGLKGEIRILSDFEYKEKVFVPGMTIYIGRKKELEKLVTYRHHKNFEMITMEGFNDINEVLRFKGLYVYVKREDLNLSNNEYLDTDYIDLDVIVDNSIIGKVKDIRDTGNNKILVIDSNDKEVLIPLQKEFIKEVNLDSKTITILPIKGMF